MTDSLKLKSNIMKPLFSIFFLSIIIYPCQTLKSQYSDIRDEVKDKETKIDLFYLQEIMNGYFQCYFEYPEDIQSLIHFEESYRQVYPNFWEQSYGNTVAPDYNLRYLKEHQNEICIWKNDTITIIQLNDSILSTLINSPFGPCDLNLLVNKVDGRNYAAALKNLSSPRYFDNSGRAVIETNELDSLLNKKKLEIQTKFLIKGEFTFSTYEYNEETIPINVFFEYIYKDGLFYYCKEKEKVKSNLPFFQKLNESLKHFCKEYNISRIIFPLPEYNLK